MCKQQSYAPIPDKSCLFMSIFFLKNTFRATNQYLKLEKPQKCIKSGRIIAEKKVLHVSYIYHTNNILTIDYYYNHQQ